MSDDHFPLITLRGGPLSRHVEIMQDGVPMKGVVKFLIRGGVNDAIYLYTRQIIRLDAELMVENFQRDTEKE